MSQVGNVRAWLEANGFTRFADTFEENEIDGEALLELTEEHLRDFGITLGPRLKLLKAIQSLRREADEKPSVPRQAPKPGSLGPRGPEAERRQLTVLFCDLVGSTALAARLDPEDLRAVIRSYQAACADVIGHFEGYVAKFLGDGVLVYFGWPTAHEDDAERAVRAGLQLVETLARLQPHADVRLQARIGIATGQVVVGDLIGEGHRARKQWSARPRTSRRGCRRWQSRARWRSRHRHAAWSAACSISMTPGHSVSRASPNRSPSGTS